MFFPVVALARIRAEEARRAQQDRERKEKERDRRVQPYSVPTKGVPR